MRRHLHISLAALLFAFAASGCSEKRQAAASSESPAASAGTTEASAGTTEASAETKEASAESESSAVAPEQVPGRLGSRVFVVQRDDGQLAIYDYHRRRLLERRIDGLGNLNHATMTFSPDLRYGYVATRGGKLSRIDLQRLEKAGSVQTSDSSIDIAITRDGGHIATAEYKPGGVTILDAETMEVTREIAATYRADGEQKRSRATGIVDAMGNRLVFSLMEGGEAWIVDADEEDFPVTHRIPLEEGLAYDAMVTPDGRYYVVGHMKKEYVSVVDLAHPEKGAERVSLRDPDGLYDPEHPVKLPHMASWAVAGDQIFVPLVGESRLAVLDRHTWEFEATVELRGHPVYAVRSPAQDEIWVSFSGEEDDAWVQVVETDELEVTREIEVGRRIYHIDFTPRGTYALVSANEDDTVALVDTDDYEVVDRQSVESPSGLFGIWRAFQIGL